MTLSIAFYAFAASDFRNGKGLALDGMHRAMDTRFEEMRLVRARLSVRIDRNGGGVVVAIQDIVD